jgi:lambda family phage portal protein
MSVRAMVDNKNPEASRAANEVIDTLWWEWSLKADFYGITDFDGLQQIAVRNLVVDGGVLVRKRRVSPSLNIPLSFQIQLLEVDYLDDSRDHFDKQTGRTVLGGVQFDRDGRRTGYWIHRQHPSARALWAGQPSVFVPANEMLLVFDPLRAGQQIGQTRLKSVLQRFKDIDGLEDAEFKRKQAEACLVATVTDTSPDFEPAPPVAGTGGIATHDGKSVAPSVTDYRGRRIEEIEPGMFIYGPPGRDIKFNQPNPNPGFSEYLVSQLRGGTAGMGVNYEHGTGDLSRVNFSSSRMGENHFKRRVRKLQNKTLQPQLLRPVYNDWFIAEAQAQNRIPAGRVWSKWTPPRWDSIQPLDDARADLLDMRSGAKTFGQVCAERGLDPVDQMREMAEYQRLSDQLGLRLDSDPRHRTSNGSPVGPDAAAAAQSNAANQGDDPNQEPPENNATDSDDPGKARIFSLYERR